MKARINTYAFRQTRIESGNLGVLGCVAHSIAEEAEYEGTILQDGVKIANFRLTVDSASKNQQIDIDLASITPERRCREERFEEPALVVVSKGYLVLYVSEGRGGFHVFLDKLAVGKGDEGKPSRVFDSRTLQRGDVFIVSLLRPGLYEVVEQFTKGKGQINVAYPTPQKQRYFPPQPEKVRATKEGLNPAEVDIRAAQSVVFAIELPKASIMVNLIKPDNGPRRKGEIRDKVRWMKLQSSPSIDK